MAIYYEPGPWGGIGQGIQKGFETYTAARQRKIENDLRTAAEKRANDALILQQQMARPGIEQFDTQQAIRKAEANPMALMLPALAGLQSNTQSIPGVNPTTGRPFTPSDYQVAGLPTLEERGRTRRKAAVEDESSGLALETAREQATPQAKNVRGFERVGRLSDEAAAGNVDKVLNRSGGTKVLTHGTKDAKGKLIETSEAAAKRITDEAFNEYVKTNNLQLDAGQTEQLRTKIESVVIARQQDAIKDDLERLRIGAAYANAAGNQPNPLMQMLSQLDDADTRLTASLTELDARKNSLMNENKMAGFQYGQYADKPREVVAAEAPMLLRVWDGLHQIDADMQDQSNQRNNVRRAKARVASGNLNIADLLNPDTSQPQGRTQAPTPPVGQFDWRALLGVPKK